ncbi:MAG: DUF2065 domain-containing protein [Gammaproteobacteria bacterium]|nr:DUF2065 domain-containing protein [Gammaproteobacteria bacterium]
MWQDLFAAIGLMLVLEGILPFISPARWRETMLAAASLPQGMLRGLGLASMLGGLALIYLVR